MRNVNVDLAFLTCQTSLYLYVVHLSSKLGTLAVYYALICNNDGTCKVKKKIPQIGKYNFFFF